MKRLICCPKKSEKCIKASAVPMAFMIQSIMSSFENGMPTRKYRSLENEILFTLRKKNTAGSLTKIFIGVAPSRCSLWELIPGACRRKYSA